MADVTFMGLGVMGAALARCARGAGYETAVWNRTATRAAPLAAKGAQHIPDAAEAVAASPILVVCVDDYAASDSFLQTLDTKAALKGRTLVQLSTGSPAHARAAQLQAQAVGVDAYLDGAILDYPSGIGSENCVILLSGDPAAYESATPILHTLAPAARFLGEDVGLASTLDEAVLSALIPSVVGTINGAALCEAGGLPIRVYREMLEALTPLLLGAMTSTLQRIEDDDLHTTEASIRTYTRPLSYMMESAEEAGFSVEVPKLLRGVFDRAIKRGLGDDDIAALIQVLRPGK